MAIPTPHPLFDHENFNFEEPRQIIINYAMRNNDGNISRKQVRNCRLVNSDWLQITTQVLRQARKPLFYLKLDQDHCFKGSGYFGKKDQKLLELDQTLTFALTIEESYFPSSSTMKTVGQYLSPLSLYRDNLVSLKVTINPRTSHLLFPDNLKLSLLQQLRVVFTKDTSKPASLSLGTIYDSCPELKILRFPSKGRVFHNVVLPEDFTRVNLSKALTDIEFTSNLDNEHLEIMTRSSLPKLKRFSLLIHRTPFEEGLIYRVLDNVKSSLEYLFFQGEAHDESPEPPTYFRFPVMEKLKQLDLETQHLKLEPEVQFLESFLPNLTELRLMFQSQSKLNQWTKSNSHLTSVTMLYVTMTNDNFRHTDPYYFVNLNETVIREIARTFPNVNDFTIDFCQAKFNALKAVWQEMKQIEELTLFVPTPKGIACQDRLTSALLGIPLKTATSLRTKRIQTVDLGKSSVKEMENLETLQILKTFSCEIKNSKKFPLLSDSVFKMALFEMPQLENIFLYEKCWVSQKMTQEWESSGRYIFE